MKEIIYSGRVESDRLDQMGPAQHKARIQDQHAQCPLDYNINHQNRVGTSVEYSHS